jgi:uncharacterized protein YciI
MHGYLYRLFPPRPTFPADMSAEEQDTMQEHVAYWSGHMAAGRVLAFGPVADTKGPYGLALVLADSDTDVEALRAGDPAIRSPHGFTADVAPIQQLITPSGTFSLHQTAADEPRSQ